MMEPAGAGSPLPRAFLRVGGRTLARHQLGLALEMDCQRVVCLAREVGPEVIALQHQAERASTQFHVISETRGLAGLVTANDELLVISEGLLVARQDALKLLDGSHAVLVQPAETGVGAGFERIDLNHASAGLMRIPGRFAEGLFELPADCDIASALTRIALQAGIAMREVPLSSREGARWRLIRDEAEAQAVERDWIRLHIAEIRAIAPTTWLARSGVLAFGPSLLHARGGGKLVERSTVASVLLALGAGWLGLVVVGFLLCAIASVLAEAARMLRSVESDGIGRAPPVFSLTLVLGWAIDLVLVLLMLWNASVTPWETMPERAFAPILLVLLARLVPRVSHGRWNDWVSDRALLSFVLAILAVTGVLQGAVQLLAVALALGGLLVPGRK
ncbi:MAG: hypothetical protein H6917_09825 [Novosphingobium sp.]|nr:hypothetical protein [Novosphingobium sp.]MCP5402668.1 hypothetical protein [Novosphingobium sp.]